MGSRIQVKVMNIKGQYILNHSVVLWIVKLLGPLIKRREDVN